MSVRLYRAASLRPWWITDGDSLNYGGASPIQSGTTIYLSHLFVPGPIPCTIIAAKFYVHTQSGNYDIGIYAGASGGLTRLWSLGATPVPSPGLITVTLGTPLMLQAGYYWSAFQCDSTSAAFAQGSYSTLMPLRIWGITGSSLPLPATVTTFLSPTSRRYGPVWVIQGSPAF
jgi:hypothetical protein